MGTHSKFLLDSNFVLKTEQLVRFQQIVVPLQYSESVERFLRHSHKVTTMGSTPIFATLGILQQFIFSTENSRRQADSDF